MAAVTDDDPYLWLEDVDGAAARAWVDARNAETVQHLATAESFADLRTQLREVLDAPGRIPWPTLHNGHLYNLWRDADHPRGLWRRTTLASYRAEEPDWDVLLDLDELARVEAEHWVWKPAVMPPPGSQRCLVTLSRGGSDAAVVREFDLTDRAFVPDGFVVPEAKSWVGWVDEDRIFVATDFGPGTLSTSGYPRVVKQWRRGAALADAELVLAGEPTDMLVYAERDHFPGHHRDFVYRRLDFFRTLVFLRTASGDLVHVDAPPDAAVGAHGEWLLIRLRSPWTVGGETHVAGSLLASPVEAFLAGERSMTALSVPGPRSGLVSYRRTRRHVILQELTDVRGRLIALTPGSTGWDPVSITLPDTDQDHVEVWDTDPQHGDEFLAYSTGFTRPDTLWHGHVGDEPAQPVRREPEYFDTAGIEVVQHTAISADGTEVPYFVVGAGSPGPTLLTGYGGYEISLTPHYDGCRGRGWLAGGGTYAVANIRGGGEFGAGWHRAAMREGRLRAYEDFAAVARDLVARGITEPHRLAVSGGSNGGLLTGVMLTRYPELVGAVVSLVPLFDMRRYHRLLAGASWIAEYGDPDDPADWAFLSEYSPYHHVRGGRSYPPTLVATSTRDDRVHPGHARKMVARLREHGCEVVYYENTEGGHAGAADNEQASFMLALQYAFLWRHLRD